MPKRTTQPEAAAPAEPRKARTAKPRTSPGVHKHTAKKADAADEPQVMTEAAQAPAKEPVSHERIALLAYSFWEARGCQGGCAEEDWLRAERQLSELP